MLNHISQRRKQIWLTLLLAVIVPLSLWLVWLSLRSTMVDIAPPAAVNVAMTWECGLPSEAAVSDFVKSIPSAKPVVLRFVRYPNVYIIQAQPGLCDALVASGKTTVTAVINPSKDGHDNFVGWSLMSVGGHRVEGLYEGSFVGAGKVPPLKELLR